MSYSIDANILIYASNQESSHNNQAIEFLSNCLKDSEPIYLCWPTVFAYLRISTHPNIFNSPLSPDEAILNVETLRASSHVRFIHEGEQFWDRFSEINNDQIIRGNLVPDAHVASLLREQGIHRIYSRDRDFLKFPFLEVIDPFD